MTVTGLKQAYEMVLSFFSVYVMSEEFGQRGRQKTKPVWQVGLVAEFVVIWRSAESDLQMSEYAFKALHTEKGLFRDGYTEQEILPVETTEWKLRSL